MIRKIKARLHGTAGESIAETLIALLIAALAMLMLAGAITSAAKMVTSSREAITKYDEEKTTIQPKWEDKLKSALN